MSSSLIYMGHAVYVGQLLAAVSCNINWRSVLRLVSTLCCCIYAGVLSLFPGSKPSERRFCFDGS